MIQFDEFCGGPLDTNAFLLAAPDGKVLIDAPLGAADRFRHEPVRLLLLTHGHFDHVADAAAILRRHRCRVGFHPDTAPMVSDPHFFRRLGFALEIEPFAADFLITETPSSPLLGLDFQVLEVPGHCPGSLCFHLPDSGLLFGGDVLFRGGIGRWDLPGGDKNLLLEGIRTKLAALPPETRVLPGHGPATTIGHELATNPWLQA